MALETWVMVAAGCTATGVIALATRQLLHLVGRVQEQRLDREGRALLH